MGREEENTGFTCAACAKRVGPLTNGSYRNHCPFCLSSLHLDVRPGDRASSCGGVMDAVDVRRTKKGWQLEHRCRRCRAMGYNRVASDTLQPDDLEEVIQLMEPMHERR